MDCGTVLDNLTRIAESDLSAEELLLARAHLAECPTCGAAYRDVVGLASELRSLPRPEAPPALRAQIAMALNAADAARAQTDARSPWELFGPYVAAAAVIAIAFGLATLVTRPRDGGRVARAPAEATRPHDAPQGAEALPTAEGTVPPPPTAGTPASTDERSAAAVEAANRRIRELQDREAMRSRDGTALWPSDLEPGREGSRPVGSGAPPGTRPGTFSPTPTGPEPTIEPPPAPTQIDVSFRPPDRPLVGTPVFGMVELAARDSLPQVVVSAIGDDGLTIDKPNGTLYSGPLKAGETVRVPVPMTASREGLHEIQIRVDSDAPGAATDVKAFVPNFRRAGTPSPAPAAAADKPVNLVFKNAPVRQALLDIARQAGVRVEMAEGLGAERISEDVRGVPARAALRAVAESGGYQVDEVGEVFRITRAARNGG